MCGIAGIIAQPRSSRDGSMEPLSLEHALRVMTEAIRHRGPDDQGLECWSITSPKNSASHGWVGLGHRRLSILDCSPAGHQPMRNPRTGDWLIYNGELYNFQALRADLLAEGFSFRGHSDTEVMLYAFERWGVEASLKQFAGMYALAFWDARKHELILARDPLGIKPLYVMEEPGLLLFASEVRSIASGLRALGRSAHLDPQAIASYLAYGAVQAPLTMLQGVRSFPGGFWKRCTLDAARLNAGPLNQYWDFPPIDHTITEQAAIERLRTLMDQSVREHLISDVPVGVFLSGGLDSTILASIAARHAGEVKTFTVGFPDECDLSESQVAAETARHLGLHHTDIPITHEEALASSLEWLDRLDQPSIDGLNTYVVSKAVRTQGIVVALSGLGADELFCGYSLFADLPKMRGYLKRLGMLPSPIRHLVARIMLCRKPDDIRLKFLDMISGSAEILRLSLYRRRLFSDSQMQGFGVRASAFSLPETFQPTEALDRAPASSLDLHAAISRFEMRFYMKNMLLRDSDTMAMAHGLEIRVPFLDRRLVDFASSIPGPVRIPEGKANKHLLRLAFRESLRDEVLSRTKMGFTLPITRWLAGPMREFSEGSLRALKQAGLVDASGIESMWTRYLATPSLNTGNRALGLVSLGHYVQSLKSPSIPTIDNDSSLRAAATKA
jgi:asparagine synthase (glutamine-hydrolysing)